ncbi:unnamed protein product [Trichogramma brassicae]|uniref:Uncharacterized protein n=1 Tax=Trichogramma brassicae TaxID=86971 RepID=A0A6H5IZW4_9HYME|nr:unnamed protein product [Trichogramma brassicae]
MKSFEVLIKSIQRNFIAHLMKLTIFRVFFEKIPVGDVLTFHGSSAVVTNRTHHYYNAQRGGNISSSIIRRIESKSLFIDWAVYDRNRHLRIVDSSKKCDPKRVLKYVPQCSELPHEAASKDEVFRFSLLSKPKMEFSSDEDAHFTAESNERYNIYKQKLKLSEEPEGTAEVVAAKFCSYSSKCSGQVFHSDEEVLSFVVDLMVYRELFASRDKQSKNTLKTKRRVNANPLISSRHWKFECHFGPSRGSQGKGIRDRVSEKLGCPAALIFILSRDGSHYCLNQVEQHQGHEAQVSNPSSRSVLSCIENVDVPPKRSIFDVSGHSSPLMFSSESDGNENSPPRKLAKCTTRSGHEPSPKVINAVFEPEVISEPSCSPDNHDIEVIDNVPYMVPVLNPCGRPKGAVQNAFGLKLNSCELQPYGQLHIDIRAEMILERIVRSEILLNKEYGVHPIHFHELYYDPERKKNFKRRFEEAHTPVTPADEEEKRKVMEWKCQKPPTPEKREYKQVPTSISSASTTWLAHALEPGLGLRMRIELTPAHAHGTIVGLSMRIGQISLAHAHEPGLGLRMRIQLTSKHEHGTIVGLRMRIGQIVGLRALASYLLEMGLRHHSLIAGRSPNYCIKFFYPNLALPWSTGSRAGSPRVDLCAATDCRLTLACRVHGPTARAGRGAILDQGDDKRPATARACATNVSTSRVPSPLNACAIASCMTECVIAIALLRALFTTQATNKSIYCY